MSKRSGIAKPVEVPRRWPAKAVVLHARDPDGNPVIMLVAPANQ